MSRKKNIIILGVTGQDGSFMARYLLKKNFIVHGLVRKSATGNLNNIKDILNNKNFFIHHGDLLDPLSIEKVIKKIKPQEIYNFADQDHVRWSFEIPSYSFDVTGASVIRILEIIRFLNLKTKYYQATSSELFGEKLNLTKFNEKSELNPKSPYGASKLLGGCPAKTPDSLGISKNLPFSLVLDFKH